MVCIRQPSDLLCPGVNENQMVASRSTFFRHHEKASTVCKNLSNKATVIRICYTGYVTQSKGRYASLYSQFTDGSNQEHESVMAVKSFPKKYTHNAKSLFHTISKEACTNFVFLNYALLWSILFFQILEKRLQLINVWLIILMWLKAMTFTPWNACAMSTRFNLII